MPCRAVCLLGVSLAAMAGSARAEEAPAGAEIVVTGRGLEETPATPAYSVQRIDRARIAGSASGRIEDVLSSVAGFQQFRRSDSRSANPSAQGVTLRALGGNATSRALVLLDGVPLADPMFGYIPFSSLAPERLGSIRVTRGGGSGAFGAGAVAGTIELESADANQLGLFSGAALANDRGETELSATLAPRLGQGFVVASARWDRGGGFWTTPEGPQRVPASVRARYESWSASLRGVAPLTEDIELQAGVRAFEDHRTLRFAGADSRSTGQDASLRLVGRGAWQFDALAYVQLRDFSNVVVSANTFTRSLDQRRTPSTGIGGKMELRPPVGEDHVLRFGTDWRWTKGDLQEDVYNVTTGALTGRRGAGGRNSDIGLFVEDDWTIGPVVLTGGLRADRWAVSDGYFEGANPACGLTTIRYGDRSGWATSWRAGAVWRVSERLSVRTAGYSGIRQPTLNELYRLFSVPPVTTCPNAELRNEQLRGYEVGVDWAPMEAIRLSLTAFDNRVGNAIANVTDPPGGNLRQRRNVNAVQARGLELSVAARAGRVSLDGSLALTDASVETPGITGDGFRPAQTPKIAASATLGWRPSDGWLVSATLRHVGAQFEDDLQTDILPAATTLDVFAEVPVGPRFSVILRGENLTDTDVVTRKQGISIDLGAPRTVWAGIRVKLPH